jgi:hypothetical protein
MGLWATRIIGIADGSNNIRTGTLPLPVEARLTSPRPLAIAPGWFLSLFLRLGLAPPFATLNARTTHADFLFLQPSTISGLYFRLATVVGSGFPLQHLPLFRSHHVPNISR